MRYPAVAGRFYPADKSELTFTLKSCFTHELGPGLPDRTGKERRIKAAIVPHAGYAASGMNAAHAYRKIAEDGLPEAYVIIGPDHNGIPYDFAMCSDEYMTPLGPCRIHEAIAERLGEMIPDDPTAHRFEHSVEVQVPFIQFIDPDPKIIPIIMRDQSIAAAHDLSTILREACDGYDAMIIASSDMTHYIPKKQADVLNRSVIDKIKEGDVPGMYDEIINNDLSVCGYGPMATAMYFAHPSETEILKYSDSWDSLKYDINSVVGYCSAVMYK